VRDDGTHALQVKALLLGVADKLAVGVDLPARRDQERAELAKSSWSPSTTPMRPAGT